MMTFEQQGKLGEMLLNEWFKEHRIPHLYINQSQETFNPLFSDAVKRPDFLMLIESIGLLAVDAKNCSTDIFDRCSYTLSVDEIQKATKFERLFRIPVWYAFRVDGEWGWISLLRVIEAGEVHRNKYVRFHPDHFATVRSGCDLGMLFVNRLWKLSPANKSPLLVASEDAEGEVG